MSLELPPVAAAFIRSVNERDPAAFRALFAPDAVVRDAGHEHAGFAAIQEWSDRDIYAANVTLEPVALSANDGATVVTTKVDGDFDRTGLPDPLYIDQSLVIVANRIANLTCTLSKAPL